MEKELVKRKLLRLQQFDYAAHYYYFITICCKDKRHLFGKVVGAAYMPPVQVCLNETGKLLSATYWQLKNISHRQR